MMATFMQTVIQYAPMVAGLYFVWFALLMKTENLMSAMLFKYIPFILGLLILVPFLAKFVV